MNRDTVYRQNTVQIRAYKKRRDLVEARVDARQDRPRVCLLKTRRIIVPLLYRNNFSFLYLSGFMFVV
jgi:hypothetical protein